MITYLDFIATWENPDNVPNGWLWERIRIWRDKQLAASDFSQLPDSPCDKNLWAEYRQALRDLPQQNENPKKIVFPNKPK